MRQPKLSLPTPKAAATKRELTTGLLLMARFSGRSWLEGDSRLSLNTKRFHTFVT